MAATFQGTQTTLAPEATETPIQTNVFDAGASVFGQAASDTAQTAAAQGQRAVGLFGQANAAFDRTVDQYNKIAVMNAQDEAPGLIQKDGNGQIIPPSSFWPSGFHSMAYATAYQEAARSTYRTMAASEYSNFVAETQAKFPTDPVAFKKAVDQKQQMMLQNLDPKEAPFIGLRLQQIAAQGGTQVAVNLQAANNATLKAQSDVSYAAVVDTASRLAGVTAPTAAFGGKDNPAIPGAIGTITGSLDPEIQKRITSADRTPAHNDQVGGAPDSAHLKPNTAVDIGTAGMTDEQKKALVGQVLANPNLRGIGFYDDHIHIDTGHDKHTVWGAVPGNLQGDVRNWQGAPTAMTAVPTSTDIEKLTTQVASSAVVAGMLADWQKQASTITTPDEIARKKNELAYTVVAKRYAEVFKSGRYDDGKGNIDQGKIALAEQNIEKVAQAFPGREDQVRKTLQEGLQFSITQSSRFAAQQQLDDKRKIEPAQRRAMDLALQADALKDTDIDGARRIKDQLRQEARDALNNPSINDAASLQLANAYYTSGNLAKSSMQEGITNKVQGINAVVHDPTATMDQKAAADASARAIRNDPDLYGNMNAGQRSYLQGTMDDYVKQNYATQLGAFNSKILEGNTPPNKIAEVRQMQIEKGILQPEQVIAAGQIDAAANKLYRDKQTQSTQAGEVVQNYQNAKPSSPEQIEAHKKELNWKPPGGGPTVDLANPAHIAAVQEHYQKYGYLPDAAVSALNSMKLSPDENAIAGPKALFATIRQVERQQADKLSGNANTDPDKDAMIEANVASAVGKNYSFLKNATLFDAVSAHKVAVQVGTEPNKAGAAGQTPDQLNSSLDQAGSNLERMLSKRNLGLGAQLASDPASLFRSDQDMTADQQALKAAGTLVSGGSVLSGNQGYENVRIDPNVMQAFKDRGTVRIAFDGKALHASQGPDGSVENHVMNTVFADAIKNGELSATRSADGKTLNVGWQTLGSQFSKAIGTPITPKMEQGVAAGLVEMEHMRVGGTLTEVNPDYVSVLPYQAKNGQQRYLIAEKDRNGNTTTQLDLAKDDPRIAVQAIAAIKSATQAVVANAADPEIYGKALAGGAVASGVGALALIKDGDIAGNWSRVSTAIGSTVQQMQIALNRPDATRVILGDRRLLSDSDQEARKNYQVQTAQMLQQLDASLKKVKDAPDLTTVLTHMMEEHLPGVDDSRLRQLIKDAGFYQPGREPRAPYKSPTRVGP